MAKIKIEDLPQLDDLSLEEMRDFLSGKEASRPAGAGYSRASVPPADAGPVVSKPRRKKAEPKFKG